jgi:hypothetical protein
MFIRATCDGTKRRYGCALSTRALSLWALLLGLLTLLGAEVLFKYNTKVSIARRDVGTVAHFMREDIAMALLVAGGYLVTVGFGNVGKMLRSSGRMARYEAMGLALSLLAFPLAFGMGAIPALLYVLSIYSTQVEVPPAPSIQMPLYIAMRVSLIGVGFVTAAGTMWRVHVFVKRHKSSYEPTCHNCGHSLRGLNGFICPECGRSFKDDNA